MKIIKFVYATIILQHLFVRTSYQNDWITDDGDSESDSEQGHAEEDGLNVSINLDDEKLFSSK